MNISENPGYIISSKLSVNQTQNYNTFIYLPPRQVVMGSGSLHFVIQFDLMPDLVALLRLLKDRRLRIQTLEKVHRLGRHS